MIEVKASVPHKDAFRGWAMAATVRADEVRSMSLRNALRELHAARGDPGWTLPETVDLCIQVDLIHERRGVCSSSRFRENRHDERFVRAWVLACEFGWLSAS